MGRTRLREKKKKERGKKIREREIKNRLGEKDEDKVNEKKGR